MRVIGICSIIRAQNRLLCELLKLLSFGADRTPELWAPDSSATLYNMTSWTYTLFNLIIEQRNGGKSLRTETKLRRVKLITLCTSTDSQLLGFCSVVEIITHLEKKCPAMYSRSLYENKMVCQQHFTIISQLIVGFSLHTFLNLFWSLMSLCACFRRAFHEYYQEHLEYACPTEDIYLE